MGRRKRQTRTEKQRTQTRNSHLQTKFQISLEEYNQRFAHQGERCAICGGKTVRLLAVDHNHETGQFRGLLCHNCNVGLGLFHDNVTLLLEAAAYLELEGK